MIDMRECFDMNFLVIKNLLKKHVQVRNIDYLLSFFLENIQWQTQLCILCKSARIGLPLSI